MAVANTGMSAAEIIGYVASVMTTVAFLPQAIRTIRTKSTGDLSLPTYALLVTGVVLWLVYGLLEKRGPVIVANSVTLPVVGVILVMIVRDRAKRSRAPRATIGGE